ncbi:MAG: hypothetical protein ACR2G4_14315 [Pyrinomonadaceae bacterium]
MLRSIFAVIAGSVVWMVTALGMDAMLMSLAPMWFGENGKVESLPVLLLMLSYSLSFSVLGGYVTALIAGRKEVRHALILGVLQLVMGLAATIRFFDTAPVWYHVLFLTLLIPTNVLGGRLRVAQKRKVSHGSLAAV